MNAFIAICILVSLPMSMALNCYQCIALSNGCNDPFNPKGTGVTTTGSNSSDTYCMKVIAGGVVARSGTTYCITAMILNEGTTCCQTDLCNGARANYQMSILLVVSLAVILAKIQWA